MPDAAGIRAGAAYVELSVRDHRLVRGLNAAAARLKAFGASITALGTRLAGLGAFLGTPLLAAVKTFADMGDHVAKAAARLGVTTEALSEIRYATERSGGTAEDLEKSLRAMSKTVIEAARGSRDARRELQRLGLTVHDLSGLSPDQQFQLIADRLAKIRNPAQRATIALGIFGKSGAKLLPLLAAGSQGIRALRNEARELGLSIATDDAQAAEAFVDALTNLWGSLKRVAFLVGASLAPALQRAAQGITTAGKLVGDWIQRNRQWVLVVGGVVAGLTAVGLALLALGPALSAIGAGIGLVVLAIKTAAAAVGLLGAAISFLLSPIGLVVAAVGGIATAVLVATDEGAAALGHLAQGFANLQTVAVTAWQGIADAIAIGDLAGAMEVAWLGLQVAWETGIAAISQSWRHFKAWFVELFWNAVYALAHAFNTAWTGIEVAFWSVVNALADGWDGFVHGLTVAFNEFVAFFRRAWARVKNIFNPQQAEEEVAAINREVQQQNQQAREKLDRRVQERGLHVDQAREAGRQREAALDQMHQDERRQRQREIDAADAADQERIAIAQQRLADKVAEMAAKRQQVERERQPAADAHADPGRRQPGFDLEGLDEAEAKTDVQGTFNALAVAGLGADSLAERTAKATEQIAKNTDKLVREAQHGGLVFA